MLLKFLESTGEGGDFQQSNWTTGSLFINMNSVVPNFNIFTLEFKRNNIIRDRLQILLLICGAMRDLVPVVQFKKREKHPWKSFSHFLNCTNGTKLRNASHIRFKP